MLLKRLNKNGKLNETIYCYEPLPFYSCKDGDLYFKKFQKYLIKTCMILTGMNRGLCNDKNKITIDSFFHNNKHAMWRQ